MPSRSTLSPQPKTAKVRQSPARTVTGTKKRYSKTKLGCKTCKLVFHFLCQSPAPQTDLYRRTRTSPPDRTVVVVPSALCLLQKSLALQQRQPHSSSPTNLATAEYEKYDAMKHHPSAITA